MFLLDQNLSHFLVDDLRDTYQPMYHVKDFDMVKATDQEIWEFAKLKKLTVITKDSDFYQMSVSFGFPPKIIWLNLGNCSTKYIADVLRRHKKEVINFINDKKNSFMIINNKKF